MTPTDIAAMDAADPLAPMRDRFLLPEGLVYLDGNSLGALPKATPDRVRAVVENEWGLGLIGSWNDADWIGMPQRLGARIAPLIGAHAHEVVVADSTSVNLFKLIAAACLARPERMTILTEPGNFPTDLYVASGVAGMMPDRRVRTADADAIVDAIDDDVAVVVLTHVHYRSGRRLDMAAITAAAHAKGALILWDLSHSVGAVPVALGDCGVDLAVGCGYKYLNGGPGAPAFLYVAEGVQDTLRSPLSGWMGHKAPFAFDDDYTPGDGVDRFLCGTPPIVAMAALDQGLAMFDEVDFAQITAKSAALFALFVDLIGERDTGLSLVTPTNSAERGSHISFAHPQAYAICQALIARGIVGDFRTPDILRFGLTPLYTRFGDIAVAVDAIADIVATGEWDQPHFHARGRVT